MSLKDHSFVPDLTLSLISDFELRCRGRLIEMPPSSQRLVCFLALHNKTLRRSYVSSALWLDSSEERAKASLRSSLWRVPSPDGLKVVNASNTHIRLNPVVKIDLQMMIARARAVIDGDGASLSAVDVARELCALGDDVLPGWYDDWVIMERERFRQLRLHALDQLGEQLLIAGRYADASQVGLSCVQAEPLRETAHRLLVRIYLREGNVAEAIKQYHYFADLLRDELGVSPSAAMEELVSDLTKNQAPIARGISAVACLIFEAKEPAAHGRAGLFDRGGTENRTLRLIRAHPDHADAEPRLSSRFDPGSEDEDFVSRLVHTRHHRRLASRTRCVAADVVTGIGSARRGRRISARSRTGDTPFLLQLR